jgi:gliding motility-associated-like protein
MRKFLFLGVFLISFQSLYASIFIVSNASSTGAGSLRQAIIDANTLPGLDTINFNAGYNIILASALPTVMDPLFINGPNSLGPQIEINGNTNSVAGVGILIAAPASGSTIKGLNIHGMQGQGVLIAASGCTVTGCYIGTNLNGTSIVSNAFSGIEISANLSNIKIGGSTPDSSNVVSGNSQIGINIGANCTNIKISGNKIGTNANGTSALANSQLGILVNSATNLVIGGGVNERNVVSGNLQHGMVLNSCTSVKISNNYIGVNASGTAAIPNSISGIQLNQTPARLGGKSPDSLNIISGNLSVGVDVINTNGLSILGNYIGLGADGTTGIGNGSHGIQFNSCSNILVGGSSYLEKNVISKNTSHGILIDNSNTITIKGNFIGTDKTGLIKKGNSSHGIQMQTAVNGIVIGGKRYVDGNIISCNGAAGINFEDGGTGKLAANGTIIKGNLIGTDSTTTQDFGNFVIGIILKSDNCIIGDTSNQEGNVMAGTDLFCGLLIANGNNNKVEGNFMGVGLDGTTAIPNKQDGVLVSVENAGQTANDNIIRYNTIAYNGRFGVNVGGALNSFSSNNELRNTIRFNKIYCNTSLGISLNLSNIPDQGNNGQVAPKIDFFLSTTKIVYGVTMPSLAGKKIDLYLVVDCPNCDINPQGKIWVDSTIVNGAGAWSYDYFAKFGTTIPGEIVTTVTDLVGNTSQFSTCCHAVSGTSIVPSSNPVCPGATFSITYSNGQSGDSLMLQMTLDTITGSWTNIQAKALTDPIVFSGLTIADTTFYRFITYSQGSYATAACKDSSFIKTVNLALTPVAGTASINPDTICQGSSTLLTLTGSVGNIQWQSSVGGGGYTAISGATSATYSDFPTVAQSPVLYRAKISRSVCPDVFSNIVQVIVKKAASGTITGDLLVCNADPSQLTLNGYSGKIQWQDSLPGGSWQNLGGQTTSSLTYNPKKIISTSYIRVVVVDNTGKCKDTSNVSIVVSDICTQAQPVDIPNALTPNGDGSNDVFYINNIWLYPNNKLFIYNRWGNKVYEASGYLNEWDGTRNGEKLPEATYYYELELGEDKNGEKLKKNQYTGEIVIVR